MSEENRDFKGLEKKVMSPEWRRKYLLIDMSTADVKEWLKKTDMIIVPTGSCEQHGPHLPLGVDCYTSLLTACSLAERVNIPVAPLIWTGFAPYHLSIDKPGTITIRYETFTNLFYDICRSLIHCGFKKIIVCAGHHGNAPAVELMARKIKYETGALVVTLQRAAISKQIGGAIHGVSTEEYKRIRHGGEGETGNVLCWNPELVDLKRAKKVDYIPKWQGTEMIVSSANQVQYKGFPIGIPQEPVDLTEYGNLGDPAATSIEKAQKINEQVINYFVECIDEIKKVKVEVRNREFIERV